MGSRLRTLLPDSLRARTTLAVAGLSLIFLSMIGASIDFLVLDRVQIHVSQEAQRVATNWIGSFKPGVTPRPTPKTRINLLQLVDSHGRVVVASAAAAGRPALSTMRPPVDNQIQDGTVCSAGANASCSSPSGPLHWRSASSGGEPHFVYAGMVQPSLLATDDLEIFTAAGVLLTAASSRGGTGGWEAVPCAPWRRSARPWPRSR
ncbi:hypothetical protein ACFQX6_52455 [Streptosporangium lutulentum]